jgi:XTP/dITP diphosphohydrolase
MQLIFATHNKNKVIEVKSLINTSINLLSLTDINYLDDIAETANSIEGNALLKATTIANYTCKNCFADDSGLFVNALHGAPGIFSARYVGLQKNDNDNMNLLLQNLIGVEDRTAYFKTVLALIINGENYFFEGVIMGKIIETKIGNEGFGYDPIFVPDGYTKTFAQLTLAEKSNLSHRAIAVKKMMTFINENLINI